MLALSICPRCGAEFSTTRERTKFCSQACNRAAVVESGKLSNLKHGMRRTQLYSVWTGIKTRCTNRRCKSYSNYGGRGISLCDEWGKSFIAFKEWAIANGYRGDLSIDRINCNGNYCPENCRWATRSQQNRNKRKKAGCSSRFVGVHKHRDGKWLASMSINGKRKHIGLFADEEDAAEAYQQAILNRKTESGE